VVATRVGYCGGSGKQPGVPTYHNMLDYSESIQVDFVPTAISLKQMLELVFAAHNPFRPGWGKQYAHAVFFTPKQKTELDGVVAKLEAVHGKKVATTIEPLGPFHLAEPYHQKYTLRHHDDIIKALGLHKKDAELRESAVAARLNGWLAGHVNKDPAELAAEVDGWKLSEKAKTLVLAAVDKTSKRKPRRCA
jgi:peptide methionine sulfoxide reductase MsrA